jgi:hypothetical protein
MLAIATRVGRFLVAVQQFWYSADDAAMEIAYDAA